MIPDDSFTVTARNLLIDLVKHEQIVSIRSVPDLDALPVAADAAGPDRITAARDELRRLEAALDRSCHPGRRKP